MKTIASIVFAGLLVAAALYVQLGGFLIAYGIVPNVVLIAFMAFVARGIRWTPLVAVLLGLLVFVFFYIPFWLPEFVMLAACVALARAVPMRLTGNESADFFILVAAGIVLLHAVPAIFGFSAFSLAASAGDFVYTVCLGAVIWFATIRYGKKSH